jgi:hypothetical protein
MINSEHINVKFDYFKKFTPIIKKKRNSTLAAPILDFSRSISLPFVF